MRAAAAAAFAGAWGAGPPGGAPGRWERAWAAAAAAAAAEFELLPPGKGQPPDGQLPPEAPNLLRLVEEQAAARPGAAGPGGPGPWGRPPWLREAEAPPEAAASRSVGRGDSKRLKLGEEEEEGEGEGEAGGLGRAMGSLTLRLVQGGGAPPGRSQSGFPCAGRRRTPPPGANRPSRRTAGRRWRRPASQGWPPGVLLPVFTSGCMPSRSAPRSWRRSPKRWAPTVGTAPRAST